MKDTWKDDAEAARNAFYDRARKALPRDERFAIQVGIHPNRWSVLTWRDHSAFLEDEFPGCSVMWDQNSELRSWSRYLLTVTRNYVAEKPYSYRGMSEAAIGHRRHRRQRLLMLEEARKHGAVMLVAYPLHPPSWQPAQVVVEHHVPRPDGYGWENPHRYGSFAPIRAIYTVAEFRWTVVR